jgi:hypothetical protein
MELFPAEGNTKEEIATFIAEEIVGTCQHIPASVLDYDLKGFSADEIEMEIYLSIDVCKCCGWLHYIDELDDDGNCGLLCEDCRDEE